MGCVIEASGEECHLMLGNDYLKAAEDGKSALIIAPTHAEGQKLTDTLRRKGVEGEFQGRWVPNEPSGDQFVVISGATESNNLALAGAARANRIRCLS